MVTVISPHLCKSLPPFSSLFATDCIWLVPLLRYLVIGFCQHTVHPYFETKSQNWFIAFMCDVRITAPFSFSHWAHTSLWQFQFACLLGPHQNREFILSVCFPHASLNDATNSEMMRIKEWFLSSSLNTRAVDMLRTAHLPLHNLHTTCWERKAVVEDTEHHLRIWICQDKVPISAVLCYQQQRCSKSCLFFFFLSH